MANTSANGSSRRSGRAGDFMQRARQQATLPRILTAGAVAAGAATIYAVLRDPARRERLKQSARDYMERGMSWWNERGTESAPSARHVPVS